MIVGGYSLHLYCDHQNDAHAYDEFPHVFYSESGSACRADARKNGWRLNLKTGIADCPKCAGRKSHSAQADQQQAGGESDG